jgi:hypothetical protein
MGRFAAYGQSDAQWQVDGDPSFKGIDMLHDRGLVQPGYLARAENKRLRDGVAKSRLGTALPGDFNPTFEGPIVGAQVYNNPNGSEVLLVANTFPIAPAGGEYVWALQFGRDPVKILLEAGQTLTGYRVEFVQAFNKVLLLRRPVSLGAARLIPDKACTFAAGASGDVTTVAGGPPPVPTNHGLTVDARVQFSSTGTLPASINATTVYWVKTVVSPSVFHISATQGGALITFATAGTGANIVSRSAAVPMLEWDGNFDPAHKFKPITLIAPGLNLVPAAWHGEPFANRVIYYSALFPNQPWRDHVLISEPLNYTAYQDLTAGFRINAGESNMITRVMGYFRSSIVIFMKQSIHMLTNFQLDFSQGQQRMLASLGSVGNKMPLQDGADMIFLSQPDGFYRLGEVIQDQIAVSPIPISRAIQPIIEQIHWDRAHQWACSVALGDYAYFALPLMGSSGANDVVAVYNRTTREWESGPDKWKHPSFRIHSLHTTLYDGSRQLFAVGSVGDSYNIYMLNSGFEDEIAGNSLSVEDVMETRGYTLRDPAAFKRIERAIIGFSTYDPEATVTAIGDGQNEEKELANVTKNRELSYVHGCGDFNPDTDDPNTPRREDYSTIPSLDFAGEDFEAYREGAVVFLSGTPTTFNGLKQQSLERFQIRQNGRWVSIRIANTNGQCDILNVAVEGYNTQETIKAIA